MPTDPLQVLSLETAKEQLRITMDDADAIVTTAIGGAVSENLEAMARITVWEHMRVDVERLAERCQSQYAVVRYYMRSCLRISSKYSSLLMGQLARSRACRMVTKIWPGM